MLLRRISLCHRKRLTSIPVDALYPGPKYRPAPLPKRPAFRSRPGCLEGRLQALDSLALIEHVLAHLAVLIPQGQPHPVEGQSMGLALAVFHERIKGVHECPGIAHGGEWPGYIA